MSDDDKKTDDSKLVTEQTVWVSPDGGYTNEAFPKPNVDYSFICEIANVGDLPTGPFFVHFTLTDDQNQEQALDFQQDAGLDPSATVQANVHYGMFPNQATSYHLKACVYSNSAPDRSIYCAGQFDFLVNTE